MRENLNVATSSIKSNRLRSILTILMIAVGITALLGILTATDVLKHSVNEDFEKLGATSFYIRANYYLSSGGERKRIKNDRTISYFQAKRFKEVFQQREPSCVTIYTYIDMATAKRGDKSTPPNIDVIMGDENNISFSNYNLSEGRDLSKADLDNSTPVCIISADMKKKLFDNSESPVGELININGVNFKVIGVIEQVDRGFAAAGSTMIIPITTGRAVFALDQNVSYNIGIRPSGDVIDAKSYYEQAEQIFRAIRRLSPIDENDFYMKYNETMLQGSEQTLSGITITAAIIGLITLLGAAVGLMNMMLVSVKERTAEIGVRKATGATSKIIRQQFLFESVVIAQIGCALGIVLGIIAGNIVAVTMEGPFVLPWGWMIVAVVLCILVGIASGYMPAKKAAALDPIIALRYE